MRASLLALVLVATSVPAPATSIREFEVVLLPAGYASHPDRIWQAPLKAALAELRQRCTTVVDDLVAVVEIVISEAEPNSKGTSATARFLASAGVRRNAIYEGETTIAQLQTRSGTQVGTPGLRVGMVRVELACTSAR